jgi:hypothetical protein
MAEPVVLGVIKTEKQRASDEVIGILERALEQAKAGDFEDVMIVKLRSDGAAGTAFSRGASSIPTRIGTLEMLKWDVLSVVDVPGETLPF